MMYLFDPLHKPALVVIYESIRDIPLVELSIQADYSLYYMHESPHILQPQVSIHPIFQAQNVKKKKLHQFFLKQLYLQFQNQS